MRVIGQHPHAQGARHLGHAPGIDFAQGEQLGVQGVAQVFLQQGQLLGLQLLKLGQVLRQLLACATRRLTHFQTHVALQAIEALVQLRPSRALRFFARMGASP